MSITNFLWVPLHFDNTQIAFSHLSNQALKKSYYIFKLLNNKFLSSVGKSATMLAFDVGLPIKGIVKKTIFDAFVGGETIAESEPEIAMLDNKQVGVILDYGAEAKNKEEELDAIADTITNVILQVHDDQRNNMDVCAKITAFAKNELLEKVSANTTLNEEETELWARVIERTDRVCRAAWEHNVRIYIDAEESWMQNAINELVEIMMSRYNREQCIVLNTIQLYLKHGFSYLQQAHEAAKAADYILGVKLVRGAYMEKERARADEQGYSSPVQDTKADTDKDFNRAVEYCVQHVDDIYFCVASHNEESNYYLNELLTEHQIAKHHPNIVIGQLFGMGDHITFNMAAAGYKATKYLPYGPVQELLPYLLRRANENSSVDGQASREFMLLKKEIKRRGLNVLV